MSTIAPPASPLMSVPTEAPVPAALLSSMPGIPDAPDDIPDPALPPAMLAVLAQADRMAKDGAQDAFVPAQPADAAWRTHEALLHGFCAALQSQMSTLLTSEAIRLTKQVDATLTRLFDYMQGRLDANEHAEYSLADALLKVQERGLSLHGAPYEMQVQVLTPTGVPLTLTIRKASPADLLDELTRLEGWLSANGYTGAAGAVAA